MMVIDKVSNNNMYYTLSIFMLSPFLIRLPKEYYVSQRQKSNTYRYTTQTLVTVFWVSSKKAATKGTIIFAIKFRHTYIYPTSTM